VSKDVLCLVRRRKLSKWVVLALPSQDRSVSGNALDKIYVEGDEEVSDGGLEYDVQGGVNVEEEREDSAMLDYELWVV
jgi:hypothetical protein